MKSNLFLLLMSFILPTCLSTQSSGSDSWRVFYIGGQSNMDGYGYNADLPVSLNQTFDDVWIFHGNPVGDDDGSGGLGIWDKLKPGHGIGFSSDGVINKCSERFGIELSFVKRLKELYPSDKIALIKYSRGGSSIDSRAAEHFGSWEADYQDSTGINQYDHFLKTMHTALSTRDIDRDGRDDRLIPSGIIWMQGESDAAHGEKIAKRYYYNLKRLMDLVRASLHTDDLPVVIGKISDSWNDKEDGKVWDYGELVQYAQEKYARMDGHATIVRSTRYYKYSDTWHYDSAGYIDLGEKFADAVFRLGDKLEK